MTRRRWIPGLMVATAAWLALAPSGALAQTGPVKMEWFSWSIFRFTSSAGKVIGTWIKYIDLSQELKEEILRRLLINHVPLKAGRMLKKLVV